jgi:hypothetical protein
LYAHLTAFAPRPLIHSVTRFVHEQRHQADAQLFLLTIKVLPGKKFFMKSPSLDASLTHAQLGYGPSGMVKKQRLLHGKLLCFYPGEWQFSMFGATNVYGQGPAVYSKDDLMAGETVSIEE